MTAGCRYEAFPIDNVAVAGKYFWIPAIRCRSRVMLLLTFLVLIRTDSFFPPGTASGGIANRGTPRSTMRRFVPSIREGGQNGVLLTLACRLLIFRRGGTLSARNHARTTRRGGRPSLPPRRRSLRGPGRGETRRTRGG